MAQVEVGLAAVVEHVDFAVLVGAHRARIDVDVRIELLHPHASARGASSSMPIEALVSPLPSELTTPPVTKMYLVMATADLSLAADAICTRLDQHSILAALRHRSTNAR